MKGISMTETFIQAVREAAGSAAVFENERMDRHTTFRIGGPADLFVCPEHTEQIIKVLQLCRDGEVPCFILGNGSNLLVSDAGYRGVILQLDQNYQDCRREDDRFIVKSGMLLAKLAAMAREAAYTGLEFASGIPGTVGGAVTMNAGAYGGEIKQRLVSSRILTKDLEVRDIETAGLELGYRHSRVMEEDWIVLEAVFRLASGKEEEISARMADFREQRTAKQPLEYPSAGSTFKRPEGYFAGKLIMDAGLAGFMVGDAQVSEKHCGFVINRGQATAEDVFSLIDTVRETVLQKFGVLLEPEVRFLGF